MTKRKEEVAAVKIGLYLQSEHKCECRFVEEGSDTFLYIYNDKFDLLITVCNTNKKKCVKIENILVNEEFRGNGIFTNLIETLTCIAKIEDVTLGLWCEKDRSRLFNFYTRSGFKFIETVNDHWLEYN